MKKNMPGVQTKKTGMIPFFKQDQSDDRENSEKVKKIAGIKAAKQYEKEDLKADKKMVAKATKEGKSLKDIKKMDEAKDKKIMEKVVKKVKK